MEGRTIHNILVLSHKRLGPTYITIMMFQESLLEVKKAYRFADASVLISPFSPLGSLKVRN